MEEAIKIAISGGYKWNGGPAECSWNQYEHAFLDPNFWKCLGKELGWENGISEAEWKAGKGRENWETAWDKFIDHFAVGGTPEEFFKILLAKQ